MIDSQRLSIQSTHLISLLLAIVIDERVGNDLHVTTEDLIELVEIKTDTVIGQSVLRKIVGTDSLAAIATTNERLARLCPFLMFFLASTVVESGGQFAKCLGFIFVLALFVLALDDNSRIEMRQAHS